MRPICTGDEDRLLVLMQAMQQDDPWSIAFGPATVRRTIELFLKNPAYGNGWFIEHGGELIGYIILCFDFSMEYGGRNAWVDEFFLTREWRGKGIGAQALKFFEQAARDAGATAIHLEVNQGNRAIELYRRRGFEDHHRYLMTKWLR